MAYAYLTLSALLAQLSEKLDDSYNTYWSQAELTIYIQEAMRMWQSVSGYWRNRMVFNTSASTPFYDLTTQTGTPIPFTIKDSDVVSEMLYHLLEPQLAGGLYVGTDMFVLDDITKALERRRNQFLVETGMVLTASTINVGAPPVSRVPLSDKVIDVRRVALISQGTPYGFGPYGAGPYGGTGIKTPIWRTNEFGAQAYDAGWAQQPADPTIGYSVAVTPPVTISLIPPQRNTAQLELISLNAGASLNPAVGVLMGVPDNLVWVVKWGALSDLLSKSGVAQDLPRAKYCVPLDSEILTKKGWKKHSEVILGEEVLGYDTKTGLCKWTTLRGINYVAQQEVHTYKNSNFRVRCTEDHKWVIRRQDFRSPRKERKFMNFGELLTIKEAPSFAHIVQAAKAPDGPGIESMSEEEYLNRGRGIELVLQMTSGERRAFILGMLYGEGHSHEGNGKRRTSIFAQNPGPVYDAMKLACALEGIATGKGYAIALSKSRAFSLLHRPSRDLRNTGRLKNGGVTSTEDVWCPTTDLGTWVMRQGDTITITGNCEQRYREGIQIARIHTSAVWAAIDGLETFISAIESFDAYRPDWEASVGPPKGVALGSWNLLALSPVPDTANYSVRLDVVQNAPVPVNPGDFVQIGREELDGLISYAQHLALFKIGGGEFLETTPLYDNMMQMAGVYNERLISSVDYLRPFADRSVREEQLRPRRTPVEMTQQEA